MIITIGWPSDDLSYWWFVNLISVELLSHGGVGNDYAPNFKYRGILTNDNPTCDFFFLFVWGIVCFLLWNCVLQI